MQARDHEAGHKPILPFVLLVLALSVPFWAIGALVGWQALPGLPVSALMAVCPMIAAVILSQRAAGVAGVRALLARSFDARRVKVKAWYAPVLLIAPGVMLLQYLWLRADGVELPPMEVALWAPPLMFAAFFLGGLAEELGWSAYAVAPMQDRLGALKASLLLGVIWAAWHIVPFVEAGRDAQWIAWKCLGAVATRVIMVWLFNNTGMSVFAVTLYHAMDNLSAFLFPRYGSHNDPQVMAVILVAIAVVVVAGGGPGRRNAPARPVS